MAGVAMWSTLIPGMAGRPLNLAGTYEGVAPQYYQTLIPHIVGKLALHNIATLIVNTPNNDYIFSLLQLNFCDVQILMNVLSLMITVMRMLLVRTPMEALFVLVIPATMEMVKFALVS